MMQEQQAMAAGGPTAEARQCFKCNFEAVSAESACPRCGKRTFFTAGNIRTRGGIIIALGLFIAGFVGAIMVVAGVLIYGQALKDPASARKLSSEGHVWLAAILVVGTVIVFGLHMTISGMWMLVFGKRNRVTVWIMWFLLAMVFVFGAVFRMMA